MEGGQTKAASVSRRTTLWRISRIFCFILIIGIAGLLLARIKPETNPANGKNQDAKVLRFDVFYPIGSLYPILGKGGSTSLTFRFLYSYLFTMNENGQLEPDLATLWSYDKGSFTWTIQIREGAKFHDGSPVTASDVVYSLKTSITTVWPSEYQFVDQITAVSDQMIFLCLKKDDPLFLEKIWSFEIFKQPETNDKKNPLHPIGSGPFKFDYRIEDNEVSLTANEHYYHGRPAIDRVVFYYQPDKERSWARLLAGKTDMVRGLDPQDYNIMQHLGDKFHFKTTTEPFLILLLYNIHDTCLSDPRVRMALSCAIDKQSIVQRILRGMGVVPPGHMGYYSLLGDPGLEPITYDPSKSARLLQEAGCTYDASGFYLQKNGKPLELTILCFGENKLHESIARYIQLCLTELGIRVHIKPIPFDELIQRYWRKAEFQVVLTELADVRDGLNPVLDSWEFLLNRKWAGGGAFPNPRITAIVDQINKEADRSRRQALLDELNSLLEPLQPATSLVQKTSLDVLSKRFTAPCDLSNMYYQFKLWQVAPASK